MTQSKPDWSRVRQVFLDLDGTILDLAYDNYIWRTAVPAQYAARLGIDIDAARRELEPKFAAVAHTLPWYDLDYWSEMTGLDIAAIHRRHEQRVGLLDGSIEFLEAVQASGRPIWLLTNAHPKSWKPKLAQSGIGKYFEHIVSSYDAGAPKEAAAFWEYVQNKHPFNLDEVIFADDSLPVLQSAQAFGLAQIVAMIAPDTTQADRAAEGFSVSARRLSDLLPLA